MGALSRKGGSQPPFLKVLPNEASGKVSPKANKPTENVGGQNHKHIKHRLAYNLLFEHSRKHI